MAGQARDPEVPGGGSRAWETEAGGAGRWTGGAWWWGRSVRVSGLAGLVETESGLGGRVGGWVGDEGKGWIDFLFF